MEDLFSLVANYFGKGVFKKLTVFTNLDKSLLTATKFEEPKLNHGPGAEARLRLNEEKSSISVVQLPKEVPVKDHQQEAKEKLFQKHLLLRCIEYLSYILIVLLILF